MQCIMLRYTCTCSHTRRLVKKNVDKFLLVKRFLYPQKFLMTFLFLVIDHFFKIYSFVFLFLCLCFCFFSFFVIFFKVFPSDYWGAKRGFAPHLNYWGAHAGAPPPESMPMHIVHTIWMDLTKHCAQLLVCVSQLNCDSFSSRDILMVSFHVVGLKF